MCVVLELLCHWWVDDNLPALWLGQIPVDANVIDKQPGWCRRTLLSTSAYEQAKRQTAVRGCLHLLEIPNSSWKASHLQQF